MQILLSAVRRIEWSVYFKVTSAISMLETEATCYKAALKEGISDPINEVYELKDLLGNTFHAQIGDEDGFMVFDPVAGNFIEKS